MSASTPPAGLNVDGPRPAATWVTSLPKRWTNTAERLVLLVLANDAYDDALGSGASWEQLDSWTGLWRSTTRDAIASLCAPTPNRPALITRTDGKGRPLAPGERGAGGRGNRTRYRLRTEIDPRTYRSGPTETRRDTPTGFESAERGETGRRIPTGLFDVNRSEKPVGETGRENRSGKPVGDSRPQPFPSLPFPSSSPSNVRTDRARVGRRRDDDVPRGGEPAAMGDLLTDVIR